MKNNLSPKILAIDTSCDPPSLRATEGQVKL
jgi:hypothetical protein